MRTLEQRLFDIVNTFLTKLPAGITSRNANDFLFRLEQNNQGKVFLTAQEANDFQQIVEEVFNLLSENWDVKSVGGHTETLVLQCLDANGKHPTLSFPQRKKLALKIWQETLLAPPQDWEVFYGVHNISAQGLPFTVGKVEFLALNTGNLEILARQKELLERRTASLDLTAQRLAHHEEILSRDTEIIRAKVTVQGNTSEIAIQKALHELRRTMDTMNFFADLVHGPPTLVYLPGEATRDQQTIWAFTRDAQGLVSNSSFTGRIEGSWSKYALFGERLNHARSFGFDAACSILANTRPRDVEARVLTALRWAGRAGALDALKVNYYKHSSEQEQAFTYYAICLESLFGSRGNNTDITERLASRCATLLYTSEEERQAIHKSIKDIYDKRSKIVHEGRLVISQNDLEMIRYYCRQSIIKMLTDPVLLSLSDDVAFEAWFLRDDEQPPLESEGTT